MKEQIKAWLKENGLSREWLAERVGVSKPTVDTWLSSDRGVPAKAQILIRNLMEDAAKIADGLTTQIFSVECTLEQFRAFSRAALAAGQTLEDWAIANLTEDAREYFKRASARAETPPALKVAAPDHPYPNEETA